MKNAQSIFRFLIEAEGRGERTALVTITGVIGRSSRAPGTHMAVSETGAFHGWLSGGCVEAAVVGEAIRIVGAGKAELLRFGEGSPFIDIRLPCGGGLDLLIVPRPAPAVVRAAEQRLRMRAQATLAIGLDGGMALDPHDRETSGWQEDIFFAAHRPDLRVFVVGHGAEVGALARIAAAYGADVQVLTPERDIVDSMAAQGIAAHWLKTPAASPHLAADRDSAIVLLFHDHDWEAELLLQAIGQDAFFVGAMGSRATHAARLDALRARGVEEAVLRRIRGPVGLIPATRDPDTLALSVLGQVVALREAGGQALRDVVAAAANVA
ncbi:MULTISPECIES: XdhC family protein [unclassified Sphingomonas]|uniref:XdhC family protein n=1 Tax=unclassified Sphingomonas TaxID=196159 RepID=UPI0006F75A11|nr:MULTISPECIES: XdhC family protein [unclassified Sphingomonas]KQX17866.1 hypothetical protein ASD17_19375 [Sphingomonas sp. Root1294]KQY70792.1 hypothetical protein ASD39_23275 [Sphingomonas sp. Root50]KRB91715.1 hypothetical protein ASE22_07035 [Sphingomonas sp. Root720]